MATNGTFNHQDTYKGTTDAPSTTSTNEPSSANNLSKDEVGWYFVEQYYTTLSKNPEKLHLFYGKKSQFVYGLETEVANVSVGRQAIQERIKALEFQDCKVRVSNVDSQGSNENIVIQVIGETSNKGAEPKKFVQTFVLAQQPSGYFVLNDILRYIKEEGEEEPAETAEHEPSVVMNAPPPAEAAVESEAEAPKSDVGVDDKAQIDPAEVDQKLEEVVTSTEETASVPAVATPREPTPAVPEPSSKPESAAAPVADPEHAAREVAEEELKKPEVPKDPSPTPAVTRAAAPVAAEAPKPQGPPKPMTWASRVGASAPRPVVPLPKPAAPAAKAATPAAAAPAQSAAPAAAAPAASTTTPASTAQPAAPAAATENAAGNDADGDWQAVGADSKRQSRVPSTNAPSQEKEGTLGYVKYVTDKIKHDELKTYLAQFGELVYFDINRAKNCAFVEYQTVAGYQAAFAANPHTVNGEQIIVEARRPKAGAYGGSNYNPNRGSISGRGRGGFDGGRMGGQSGGGRGGFGGPMRGGRGGGAPRGRGGAQPTNA